MTQDTLRAALDVAIETAKLIHSYGKNGIPSGHLYARLCGQMDLATYDSMIALLKKQGVITESNHVLRSTL